MSRVVSLNVKRLKYAKHETEIEINKTITGSIISSNRPSSVSFVAFVRWSPKAAVIAKTPKRLKKQIKLTQPAKLEINAKKIAQERIIESVKLKFPQLLINWLIYFQWSKPPCNCT